MRGVTTAWRIPTAAAHVCGAKTVISILDALKSRSSLGRFCWCGVWLPWYRDADVDGNTDKGPKKNLTYDAVTASGYGWSAAPTVPMGIFPLSNALHCSVERDLGTADVAQPGNSQADSLSQINANAEQIPVPDRDDGDLIDVKVSKNRRWASCTYPYPVHEC